MAYNLPPSPSGLQLRGIPDWIGPSTSRLQARVSRVSGVSDSIESKEVTYTIDATGVFPSGLSQKAREDRERAMLQNLLADRFKLKIHHETGEMPVMALIVPEGGPKLEKADIEERDCPAAAPEISVWTMCHTVTRLQGRGFFGRAVNMSDLLRQFQNSTSFPLVDNTGIHGLYRIETTASLGPALPSDGGISEAAQQLGLKLEMRSSRVDVYVIDHIEKPTVN
jgi:uncharacterized protein (TIGR03435 family)